MECWYNSAEALCFITWLLRIPPSNSIVSLGFSMAAFRKNSFRLFLELRHMAIFIVIGDGLSFISIYICDILGIFKPLFFDAVLGSQIWENSICLEQNEPFADPLTKSLLILREGRNPPNTKDIYHHLVLDVDRVKKSASRVNLNQSFLSWSQVRAKIEPSKMLF